MAREYPNALEMEKKVLSAMMLEGGKIVPEVGTILKPSDFYREEHKIIYRAICNAYKNNEGTPLDILLVEEELERKDELKKVTRLYLFALLEYEFTTARAVTFALKIREKSISRQLIESCEEIMYEACEDKIAVDELLEMATKRIFSIASKSNRKKAIPISHYIGEIFEEIVNRAKHPNELTGLETKIIGLDRALNGLQKSDLILLAARPSMGKTALALNIALSAAKLDKNVAIFSLEMSKGQLAERLLSTTSGVNSFNLKTGNLTEEEMRQLINAVEEISELRLYIDDTAGMTLLEMRSKLRQLKHETGLDLIVIDYLQLMQGGRAENRQQEISEISRSLKALAREMDVPILALSQLSRSVEMRADKKPQLSDLRESGSLEQDADIVMFLYRDEYYNRDDTANENLAELIIAKNRNGPTTTIPLQFNKEIMRFGDLTRAAE